MFDTLQYNTIHGSWNYSSILIDKYYIGKYLCLDNIYDGSKYPGWSTAKLPNELVEDLMLNINKITIISEQEIDNPLRNYPTLFQVNKNNETQIQPYPDDKHSYMLPQYAKIEKSFIACIEYLKNNGDRFFISTQCELDIDYQNRANFTFNVENKGTITGKINNFLEQLEYASTYNTDKGPGPIFTRSDCTIMNANFDVTQSELELPPNVPLVVTIKSKMVMPMGEWAFTLGLAAIQEVPVADSEAHTYGFKNTLVTVTLN